MPLMSPDIWAVVGHRDGVMDDSASSLVGEARRLSDQTGGRGAVCAVWLGTGMGQAAGEPSALGADRILCVNDDRLDTYQGERWSLVLAALAADHPPGFILCAHSDETADLAPRLGALLQRPAATRAVDLTCPEDGSPLVVRAIANGHLFQTLRLSGPAPFVVSFLPSVLNGPAGPPDPEVEVRFAAPRMDEAEIRTRVLRQMTADPENLDLEAADIVVAGGRGVGEGERFEVMHRLAKALGGTVGCTRPVVDRRTLPFDRQIGQTGKTVSPRLIVNCGISGANEYTAGMERAHSVIAVNTDPRARIFRFADLGVVGDVHEIVPRLIDRLARIRDKGDR